MKHLALRIPMIKRLTSWGSIKGLASASRDLRSEIPSALLFNHLVQDLRGIFHGLQEDLQALCRGKLWCLGDFNQNLLFRSLIETHALLLVRCIPGLLVLTKNAVSLTLNLIPHHGAVGTTHFAESHRKDGKWLVVDEPKCWLITQNHSSATLLLTSATETMQENG